MPRIHESGAERKRVLSRILAVIAILLSGALIVALLSETFLRAQGLQPTQRIEEESRFEPALLREASSRLSIPPHPRFFPPIAERSPFGGPVARRFLDPMQARGKLLTPWGHVSWDAAGDDLASRFPNGFQLRGERLERDGAGRRLTPGLNYIQLAEDAIAGRGLAAVMREVSTLGRIVGVLPDSTLLLYVEPDRIAALFRSPGISRTRPVAPYEKVAPDYGVRHEVSRHEAANPLVRGAVRFVPGTLTDGLLKRIEGQPGVTEVVRQRFAEGIEARLSTAGLERLAQMREVLRIDPVRDHLQANAENVPTIQTGSAEDGLMRRPFDEAGVDGGGIDTNGDGRRVNDGTDLVPPQIVSVTDNGLSLDTPNFSETATEVTTTWPLGPSHRKVHALQNAGDDGTTCDAPLSGAGTHGHIVASAIAAYPSQLGFFANRSGLGGPFEPRDANLDGIARGARILMQDTAGAAVCTVNHLVEQGGNVNPGNLLDRMNEVICPMSGGTGACAGITGGGNEAHLAVLPFGVPNFSEQLVFSDPHDALRGEIGLILSPFQERILSSRFHECQGIRPVRVNADPLDSPGDPSG